MAQWTTPPVITPRVEYRTFASTVANTTVSFHVYTPPEYDTQTARRFPVVYWLHGSGSATAGIGPMASRFHTAIVQGLMPPTIVVFPNGMPYGMWSNWFDGSMPIETVVMTELLPHVDAAFRTIPRREARIIEGFSMGGYGAARLGFTYSDKFGGVSLFGAGPVQTDFLDAPAGSTTPPQLRLQIYQNVWGSNPAMFLQQSPWMLAEVHQGAMLTSGMRIRQAIGESDVLLQQNIDLHARLNSLGIGHEFSTYPGVGHDTPSLLSAMGPAWSMFYAQVFAGALCDSLDFNGDGIEQDPTDMEAFLSLYSGGPCLPESASCADLDFNNDGIEQDPTDIEAFLSVYSGGPCV